MRKHGIASRWVLPAISCVALFLSGCGPDPAVLKSYILGSRRNHLALMPLTLANRQVDVRGLVEDTLRDQLAGFGFSVVDKPMLDTNETVFGASSAGPRVQDVIDYGARCRASVVLVGRIEKAIEGRPPQFATTRHVERHRRDANGENVAYDEEVIDRPERPARPPIVIINLKLFDTGTGHELWSSKQDAVPPEWTLEEAVRYIVEQQSADLAATYAARKL